MKKIITILTATALIFGGCSSDDDEPTPVVPDKEETPGETLYTLNLESPDITYDSEGYWSKYLLNENLHLDGFRFTHYLTDFGTVEGYIVSKNQDVTHYEDMYTHPYTVVGGGGMNGIGSPYLVASYSIDSSFAKESLVINRNNFENFCPKYIALNNTTYGYYTMRYGNAFCRAFAAGDWFKLTIHGVTSTGEERSVDFMLADCTSPNHPESEIVSSWTMVDLSSLGKVQSIYFTMSSSDSGQWGMNTPGYFAIGAFGYTM